jgi:hypothetical protein
MPDNFPASKGVPHFGQVAGKGMGSAALTDGSSARWRNYSLGKEKE